MPLHACGLRPCRVALTSPYQSHVADATSCHICLLPSTALSDAVVDELCIDMGLVSGVLRGGYDAVGGSAFVLGKIEQRFYNRYRPKIIQIFDKLLKRGKYAPNAKSVAMVEPTDEAPAESPATEDAKVNESIKTLFTGLGVTHVQRKHAAKRVQRQARRLLQQRHAKAPHGVSA